MKYIFAVFFILSTTGAIYAQTYEIGGMIGGSNYIGDVGKTNYIAPNSMVFGGIFKWNRSPRHSFRASLLVAGIEGDDSKSKEARRKERGYEFTNTLTEFSVGLEYTFWEFSMYSGKPASTPYLYTGLTYVRYNALALSRSDVITKYDKAGTMAIPMVLGYKATLGTKMVLGFEIGARYTFTDNLDGSNPDQGINSGEPIPFGNINNNDWYMFTGVTLTFTFGRKPCYCNF